jgi:hypothetical protein
MSVKIKWLGDKVVKDMQKRLAENLREAVTHVAENTRAALPQDTGALAASVGVKGRGLEAYWGSDLDYASDVEFGTQEQGPDGTWRRVLEQSKPEMRKILSKDRI